ncbi:MAG TPA: glucan biosynthesis protein, partial [Noviherbaspirillum sp.]
MPGNKLFSLFSPIATLLPAAAAAWALAVPGSAWAFNFEDVAAQAKTLAASPYKRPKSELPKSLQDLTYDQYRDIRFNP